MKKQVAAVSYTISRGTTQSPANATGLQAGVKHASLAVNRVNLKVCLILTRQSRELKPARTAEPNSHRKTGNVGGHAADTLNILIIDLNNFASFPTLAIGLLTASLRDRGHGVEVLCPLAFDAPATMRERREWIGDHILRRIHLTDWTPALAIRDVARRLRERHIERPHSTVLREARRALDREPDAVLLSAYLQHRPTVGEIGRMAAARGVPVILGGPMFYLPDVGDAWKDLPGLSAIVGAEVDHDLPDIVKALHEGDDLLQFKGVILPDGKASAPAAPLRQLDRSPVPDFTDFPWDRYPVRIVPVMTGRGCQWDKCLFCSDVISASGRTFRTRSVENVLLELEEQARRHDTTNFLFLDLKLNSWPEMLRGIGRNIGRYVRGAEWIGTVHVDQRKDNGLSRADLEAAAEGGMRRISFGLESGSQRLLDAMRKGSSVEGNSRFIRDAHAAGLSVRCTMFKGFPGETAADMEATARFLESHAEFLGRVHFNDFTLHTGTPIWRAMQDKAGDDRLPLEIREDRHARARSEYRYRSPPDRAYRRAKARALAVVHQINRQPLSDAARQFDGLM